jgi:hypothetical protein
LHRQRRGSWLSGRRASAPCIWLRRGPQRGRRRRFADPLFDVRRVLMHPDRGGVDDRLQLVAVSLGYCVKNRVPDANSPPSDEPVIASRRGTISFRDVRPRRAGAQSPIGAVQHLAIIGPRFAPRLVGQQRRDDRLLKIRQFISPSVHSKSSQDFESHPRPERTPLYELVTSTRCFLKKAVARPQASSAAWRSCTDMRCSLAKA